MRHLPNPRVRALHQQLRRTPGYSLTEVLMGLAVVGGLSAAAFVYFGRTDVAAQVKDEQENINLMLDRASKAYGRVGSYEGMSAVQAIEQGWAPRDLVQGNTLRNTWGTPITLQPETVDGRPNAGMRVTYQDVTTDVCTKLAQAIASSMWDVQVDGQTVMGNQRGEIDPNTMVQRCNTSNAVDVAFIYHDGSQGFLADAGPLDLPCPAPQPRTESCPPGEQGYLQQQRDPVCDADNVWVGQAWGPWTTVTDNCDPNVDCVTAGTCPPPLIPGNLPCVVPPAQFRNAGCPAGQIGSTPQTRTATCPAPTGVYTWNPWAANGASTCAPAAGCPAPETRNAACPDLQVGTRTEQRDCEGMVGTNPQWGDWYRISDTCAPAVVDPGDPCWVTGTCAPPASCDLPDVDTRTVACAAPHTHGLQYQQRTAYCLGTGANDFEWTYWYNVNAPAPTCYTCPPDETRNVTENQVATCPAGQFGSTPQTRQQPQFRTYTCPADAGPGVAGPWTDTGSATPWTPPVTCTPCPAPSNPTETQWVAGACPAGQLGGIEVQQTRTRTQSYTCPAGSATLPAPTFGTWSAWTPTGSTRNNTCYTCPAPESQSRWVFRSSGCFTWDEEQDRTRGYTCPPAAGPATANAWTPWNPTGNIQNYTDTCGPPACGSAPSTGGPASCPVGETGVITGWNAAPHPTCWTSTNNCAPTVTPPSCGPAPASGPATCPEGETGTTSWNAAPAPTCWTEVHNCAPMGTPCVAPAPLAISRDLAPSSTSSACPAPQTGTQTTTCQRSESGSRDYSCPAPTGAYTSVDNWSGIITPHSCSTNTSGCVTAAPPVVKAHVGDLSARYYNTSSPSARRIIAFLTVGDVAGPPATFTNPGEWSVNWDVVNTGAMGGFAGSPTPSGYSIDFYCAASGATEGNWTVSADVQHLPSGTTSSFSWFVWCRRDNL